jgi:hypothetical protein
MELGGTCPPGMIYISFSGSYDIYESYRTGRFGAAGLIAALFYGLTRLF